MIESLRKIAGITEIRTTIETLEPGSSALHMFEFTLFSLSLRAHSD